MVDRADFGADQGGGSVVSSRRSKTRTRRRMPAARRKWPAVEKAMRVTLPVSEAGLGGIRKMPAAPARERVAPQATRTPVVRRPMKKALVPAHARSAMSKTSIAATMF